MKRIASTIAIATAAIALTACGGLSSTKTTVRVIDPETGKVTSETVTDSKSAIEMVTESTADKTVVASSSGFVAKIKGTSGAEADSPMPSVEMSAGNMETFYVSVHKDQKDAEGVAKIISAIKGNISVTQEGIQTNSNNADLNAKTAGTATATATATDQTAAAGTETTQASGE